MLNNENSIKPNKAAKKPEIEKPGTIYAASINNKALIIRVNNPRVSKFIGRVTSIINGLIKVFIKAITAALTKAAPKLVISMPGTIQATINNNTEKNSHLIIILIIKKLHIFILKITYLHYLHIVQIWVKIINK